MESEGTGPGAEVELGALPAVGQAGSGVCFARFFAGGGEGLAQKNLPEVHQSFSRSGHCWKRWPSKRQYLQNESELVMPFRPPFGLEFSGGASGRLGHTFM